MKRAREARSELSDQRRHQCGTLLKRALCHSTADVERAPSASEFGTRPRPTVPGQAIQLLETTRPYEGYALFQIAYLRGQAYLKQQKGAEAASEFQKILDHRGYQTTSRSEEHTSELQSQSNLVCRLLLEKKKNNIKNTNTTATQK